MRAQRLRRPADAARFLASRALTRTVLARYVGSDPLAIVFSRACRHCGDTTHGRPTIDVAGPTVEFSITRAGPLVAIAIAPGPVGLDAEPARDNLDRLLGSPVFSAADRATITGAPGNVSSKVLAMWVAKEAIGKASGLGLAGAERIRVAVSTPPCLPATESAASAQLWRPATDAAGRRWCVAPIELPRTAAAAVATLCDTTPIRILDAAPTIGLYRRRIASPVVMPVTSACLLSALGRPPPIPPGV